MTPTIDYGRCWKNTSRSRQDITSHYLVLLTPAVRPSTVSEEQQQQQQQQQQRNTNDQNYRGTAINNKCQFIHPCTRRSRHSSSCSRERDHFLTSKHWVLASSTGFFQFVLFGFSSAPSISAETAVVNWTFRQPFPFSDQNFPIKLLSSIRQFLVNSSSRRHY